MRRHRKPSLAEIKRAKAMLAPLSRMKPSAIVEPGKDVDAVLNAETKSARGPAAPRAEIPSTHPGKSSSIDEPSHRPR